MTHTNFSANAGAAVLKAVCAGVFVLFSFVYLYFYQADLLAAAQHSLSGGTTHYEPLIGATLITLALMLVQWAVYAVTRLSGASHALTYLPSSLALALLTTLTVGDDGVGCPTTVCWLLPLLLLLWIGVVFVVKQIPARRTDGGFPVSSLWINMLTLCLFFIIIGTTANGNDIYHYRLRMESRLIKGDYDGALSVAVKAEHSDANLTMLRIYALAQKGLLGERLFTYPVVGSSSDIVPTQQDNGTRCIMLSPDAVYRLLGARPQQSQSVNAFLSSRINKAKPNHAVIDYVLCGYLIDRDLDNFVKTLSHYYNIDAHLPRHYREALTLYTHQRSNPLLVYHDEVMDTDFNDFQQLLRQSPDTNARRLSLMEQYAGTYWTYFFSE